MSASRWATWGGIGALMLSFLGGALWLAQEHPDKPIADELSATGVMVWQHNSPRLLDVTGERVRPKGAIYRVGYIQQEIGSEDVEPLARLSSLEELSISDCRSISDEAIRLIGELSEINTLVITHSNLGDKDFEHLAQLPLKKLFIVDVPVTDEGIQHLARLNRVKLIDFTDTKVTEDGIEKLQSQLPSSSCVRISRGKATVAECGCD